MRDYPTNERNSVWLVAGESDTIEITIEIDIKAFSPPASLEAENLALSALSGRSCA
jgi:hypothetical protein